MKPGTTTDYIHMRPFDVSGKFVIKSVVRDGKPRDVKMFLQGRSD